MEALLENLMSDDQALKLQAAEKLSRISPAARSAAVPLVLASDGQDDVAQLANKALEQMGPPLAGDVAALAELLVHESPRIASWSATLLGRLGSDSAVAAPALCLAIERSPIVRVQQQAAWALGRIGPAAGCAVETLAATSQDGNARLARLAERALRNIQVTPAKSA